MLTSNVLCRHFSVKIRSSSVKFIMEASTDGLNNANALLILINSSLPILKKYVKLIPRSPFPFVISLSLTRLLLSHIVDKIMIAVRIAEWFRGIIVSHPL